ncbi:hypothetical protein EBZ80_23600 [bacterium]|nr:hypothetical protein [bacterium]
MERRRKKSDFNWPFLKIRRERIEAADRLRSQAAQETCGMEFVGELSGLAWATCRKNARRLEKASSLYRSAGLGAAAVDAITSAAELWSKVGERSHAKGCRDAAASMDTFYP